MDGWTDPHGVAKLSSRHASCPSAPATALGCRRVSLVCNFHYSPDMEAVGSAGESISPVNAVRHSPEV